MVDAVVRHWRATKQGDDKCGFYADDGTLAGLNSTHVQNSLDIVTTSFASMGLKMNARKTEFMSTVGKPFAFHKGRPLEAPAHFEVEMGIPGTEGMEIGCPVPGCKLKRKYPSTECSRMRRHFGSAHIEHTLFIPSQGEVPRCQQCGATGLGHGTSRHRNTKLCKTETPRYQRYLRHLAEQESRKVVFNVGGEAIKRVNTFKYLGRIVSEDDDDTPAIEANIKKAKAKWAMFKRLLTRERCSRRIMGHFYKAIVQSILLYGAETWVITPKNMAKLRTFHRKAARYITNRHIRPLNDGTDKWNYPSSESVLEDAGLFEIEVYIQRRRDTVFTFVQNREIYKKCLELETDADNSEFTYWWKQPFNLE